MTTHHLLSSHNRRTLWMALAAATLLVPTAWAAANADSETPTFYQDVLPVLESNCQSCHRPGGANYMGVVAPMAFVDYEGTRPWARSIARQVESGAMPPWHASREFNGVFRNERLLSDDDKATLIRWAKTGTLPGEKPVKARKVEMPAPNSWSIGEPDLVVRFEEPVWVEDEVEDVYKTVTVTISEDQLPEDRWIQSMEFRPGSDVVHHIVIFTDDARESLGFPMGMLGGMGPGTDPTYFPPGYGRRLSKGTTIQFNMHYHKEPGEGTGVFDQSEIAFNFHDEVEREVLWGAIGTMAFSIPPNAENHEIVAEETLERGIELLALFPHTHLRGKASRYTATYPDGTTEILLDVPNYDFDWQTNYVYNEPKKLPAGTKITVQMWYDNSTARAEITGIDPSREVRWGQPTTDEMMYGFLDYSYLDDEAEPSAPSEPSAP